MLRGERNVIKNIKILTLQGYMVGGLIVVGHDINSNILSSIYQNIDL